MPVHYATQAWTTGCGIDLEQLEESERVVEDPGLVDCESCLEDLDRRHAMAQEPSYQVGYEDGKSKAFFEMASWRPGDHGVGCGCQPCLTAGVVARRLAAVWVADVVHLAVTEALENEQAQQLRRRIAESTEVWELMEKGAYAQAIAEAYRQARVAALTDGQ